MKHLFSGVALAALLTAGLPVMAQTSSSDSTKQPPAAQSGTAATGASTSMPAGTDNRQSGATTAPSSDTSMAPAKKSKAPAAADAQSGTTATGAKSSTAAGTDNAKSGASTRQSGASTTSESMGTSSGSSSKRAAKHESSTSDNMAEELNRQELQRVQSGGEATTGSGQSQAPAASPASGATSGTGTTH